MKLRHAATPPFRTSCTLLHDVTRRIITRPLRLRPLRLPLPDELAAAATAATHYSTLRYTPRVAFGANALPADACLEIPWREERLQGEWAPRSWAVRFSSRCDSAGQRAYLCYYCNGERDESAGRCEVGGASTRATRDCLPRAHAVTSCNGTCDSLPRAHVPAASVVASSSLPQSRIATLSS